MTDDTTRLPAVPEFIGTFKIMRPLGEGGMGRVYAGYDEALQREVAIKVLLQDAASIPDAGERFLREARAMARLSHPHVVTIHQVGSTHDGPYLVMELMEGMDVGTLIKERPLPWSEAVDVVRQAIMGLAAAADAGLVHRDVKPDNLFRTGDTIKVADFGLARPIETDSKLTQAGLIVGSPAYLAPELARGEDPSMQSDMYALGATFFELLTGRPPFVADGALEMITAHLSAEVPDVSQANPAVPAAVASIVTQLLQKEPADRFVDYRALLAALDEARIGEGDGAPAGAPTVAEAPAGPSATQALFGAASTSPSPPEVKPKVKASGPLGGFRSETLTVMFTDIAGYSERTGTQSREEAARWLALHDALLKPVLKAFGGKLVKTIGDALLITFKSPTDAVLCGTAMQDRLFAHNRTATESERIDVRIALSAGEVRVQRGDVFGEPVNVAARLEKHAAPGEVVFSDAVFAIMNTAEVPHEVRGQHQLKGIGRPVTLYAAVPTEKEGEPPFGGQALARVPVSGEMPVALDAVRRHTVRQVSAFAERLQDPRVRRFAAAGVGVLLVIGLGSLFVGNSEEDKWLRQLSEPNADDAVDALAAAGDGDVDDALLELALSDNWDERRQALTVLKRRDVDYSDISEQVGLLDLTTGETCRRRRFGLKRLAKVGKSEEALEAVQEASGKFIDNACMAMDVWSAEKKIKRRLREADESDE